MIKLIKNLPKTKQRYLHQNLTFLIDKFKIDAKILASQTGIPLPTIFRIKREDNNPTLSTVEPIADFFRIDLHDLLYENISSDTYQSKKRIGAIQYIPIVKLGEIKKWPISFDTKLYTGTVGNLSKKSFGIEIDTDSLAPVFYKNTIVIIDPKVTAKDTDYIFCTINDDKIPLFRQYFAEGSNYFLKSINPHYGEIAPIKRFCIIGVAVKSIESYR